MKKIFVVFFALVAYIATIPQAHAQMPKDSLNGWVCHIINPEKIDTAYSAVNDTDAYRGTSQQFYMRTRNMSEPVYWEKNFGLQEMPSSLGMKMVSRGVGPARDTVPRVLPHAYCELYVGYPDSSYAYVGYKEIWNRKSPEGWSSGVGGKTDKIPQKPFDKICLKIYITAAASDTAWCSVLADDLRLWYGTDPDSIVTIDTFGPDSVSPAEAVFEKNISATHLLDSVHVGQSKRVGMNPALTIRNVGNDTLHIAVRTDGTHFSLVPFTHSIPPGKVWKWNDSLVFSPKAVGNLRGDMLIFEHNGASSPDKVALWGYGLDPLPIPPVKAIFEKNISITNLLDSVRVGQSKKVGMNPVLTIRNTGDDTLRMTVRTNNIHFPLVSFPQLILPGKEWTWSDSLTFVPKATGNLRNDMLIFEHNGASSPDTVVLWGYGLDSLSLPPTKAVFVKNIDTTNVLDSVRVGQSKKVGIQPTLVIQNTGDDTLHIMVRTNDIHFSLVPFAHSIPPGEHWTWNDSLVFSPKAAGSLYDDMLVFEHNGASSPDTVVLAGYGLISSPFYSRREIALGAVSPNTVKIDTFSIRNGGNADLFLRIGSSDSAFVVIPDSAMINPDSVKIFTVRFTAGPTTGERKANIVVVDADTRWPSAFSDTLMVSTTVITGVEENSDVLPKVFALHQNYPNPFNPTTTIQYDLPRAVRVTLIAYDILGKEVWTKDEGLVPPGQHSAFFHASRLSSGIYFYRIIAGEWTSTKKMILLK